MSVTLSQLGRALRHAWRMTNPWRPMIRDARGRPCPLYRLDRVWFQNEPAADLPRAQFDLIRARLLNVTSIGMGERPRVLWMITGGLCLFVAWMVVTTSSSWRFTALWAVLIGIYVWAALTYRKRIPRAGRVLIAAELIHEQRCASCAYDLRRTDTDADGLKTCPECAAAWRMGRGVVGLVFCCRCDYDFRGLPEGTTVCPECGLDYFQAARS